MSAYGAVLRAPGVARIIAAQLTARMPWGMVSLAVLLHVQHVHHSYGAAGLVLAGNGVGQAISGPLLGRLMGVRGMRPVLIATTAVCAAMMLLIALVVMPLPMTMGVALVMGLSGPPVTPAVRTIYPKMVNSSLLTPLFSLDASAQELIWVLGPVLITFVSTQVSTVLGLLICAGFLVGGGAWFISLPELGRVRIPRSKRRFGIVLRRPTILVATATGFLLIGSYAAVEAGVIAAFPGQGVEAGIILAISSVGSLTAGLAFGNLPLGPWALARRMAVVFFGVALAAAWLNFWWMALALAIAGAGIAPALAAMSTQVSSSVKFSDTAEAYGWVNTGQLIGAGIGSAIAGGLIDGHGAVGAFWVSAAAAGVGILVPAAFVRWLPDMRGKHAGPIPDTEPIPLDLS